MWASDPYPGSTHDVAALDASGLLEGIDPSGWIGDKGYVGRGMITPHKKPPNGELDEKAKEENKSVNRIRRAERADHRPHQVLENPPHALPPTPGNIRADHHRSTRTLYLQNHPLNNLPGPTLRIFIEEIFVSESSTYYAGTFEPSEETGVENMELKRCQLAMMDSMQSGESRKDGLGAINRRE